MNESKYWLVLPWKRKRIIA